MTSDSFAVPFYVATFVCFVGAIVASVSRFVGDSNKTTTVGNESIPKRETVLVTGPPVGEEQIVLITSV